MSVNSVTPLREDDGEGLVNGRSFWTDLVAALGELREVIVDETADTGSYSYRYASLAQIMKAVREVLGRHGFAISQEVYTDGDEVFVVTKLIHVGGAVFETRPMSMRFKPDPQHLGSLVTYMRRYQLVGVLGLAVEDDDGKLASQGAATRQPSRRSRAGKQQVSAEQAARVTELFAALDMAGEDRRGDRLAVIGDILGREIASTKDLTTADADRLIPALRTRLEGSTS